MYDTINHNPDVTNSVPPDDKSNPRIIDKENVEPKKLFQGGTWGTNLACIAAGVLATLAASFSHPSPLTRVTASNVKPVPEGGIQEKTDSRRSRRMTRVSISIEALVARQALVFGRHLLADDCAHTEYLCDADAPVNCGKEMRRNLRMASLPSRGGAEHADPAVHAVPFEGAVLRLAVRDLAPPRSVDLEALVLRIDAPAGGGDAIDRFLDAARKHCEDLIAAPRAGDTVRRYLYDSGYWERLGDAPRRPADSVFLTDEARALVGDVVAFMTDPAVKDRHRKHGVPYKLNVLLHGPPGTGKTSLIDSVAGQLGSDVFLVQFTAQLRDTDLAVAMRRVVGHPNPVIVMEDVDCMFTDRRKRHDTAKNALTLSGFLNALDGMSRPEGSVVFLTTNDADCLDAAVTRSRRIDRTLRMGRASPAQTEAMVRSFFPDLPDADVEEFCAECSCHAYTTADLHEYLFDCRRPCHRAFAQRARDKAAAAPDSSFNPMYV